ncbi:MAG: hypothetical protein NXI16_01555 [Alphaproteobacteria bacterium]|nr:hypothetical protein [Alphaproteobacteria bacterium]
MLPPKIQKGGAGAKAGRVRSPGHLAFVRSHHCSVPGCQQMPVEAAHVSYAHFPGHKNPAMSDKNHDCFTVSLCTAHHSEQHNIGERAFEERYGVILEELAWAFFRASPKRVDMESKLRQMGIDP